MKPMEKVYTAQEMRNCADNCDWRINPCVAAMLRQAADDKARMDAVVKMLEEKERATSCSDCGRYNGYPCADHGECGMFKHHEEFTAILRAARGEGGAL